MSTQKIESVINGHALEENNAVTESIACIEKLWILDTSHEWKENCKSLPHVVYLHSTIFQTFQSVLIQEMPLDLLLE